MRCNEMSQWSLRDLETRSTDGRIRIIAPQTGATRRDLNFNSLGMEKPKGLEENEDEQHATLGEAEGEDRPAVPRPRSALTRPWMVRTAGRDGTTDLDVRPLMLFFLSRLLDDEPSPPGRRGRITSLPLRGDVPGPLLVR